MAKKKPKGADPKRPEPPTDPARDTSSSLDAAESKLPAYAQAAIAVLRRYGLGTLLALGLVYLVAMAVPKRLDALDARLSSIEQAAVSHGATTAKIAEHLRQDEMQTWQLVGIAQRMCTMMSLEMGRDPLDCVITKAEGTR